MTDVNKRLREAARTGSEAELNAMLREQSCDTSSTNENGMTALMWAAFHGKEACVRILLPVSEALAKDTSGWTALMCAAYSEHEACVRLLLTVSDASAECNRGMTALMHAAESGSEACVQLLLPVSNVQAKDGSGQTASSWARGGGYESLGVFIDAYALSQTEQAAIGGEVSASTPRKRTAPRV